MDGNVCRCREARVGSPNWRVSQKVRQERPEQWGLGPHGLGEESREHAVGFVIAPGARAPTCQRAAPAMPSFLPPVCRSAGSRCFDVPATARQAVQAIRNASARRFKDSASGQMPVAAFGESLSRTWPNIGGMPRQASAATGCRSSPADCNVTDLNRVPATDWWCPS